MGVTVGNAYHWIYGVDHTVLAMRKSQANEGPCPTGLPETSGLACIFS